MTATQIRPATGLCPLVTGIRTAVEHHGDWAETAQLVADQLRRHLPTPDVLTAEQRLGSPDDYCGHNLYVEPDGSFSNTADTTAISIHVYGTDVTRVGSSARRYYD